MTVSASKEIKSGVHLARDVNFSLRDDDGKKRTEDFRGGNY